MQLNLVPHDKHKADASDSTTTMPAIGCYGGSSYTVKAGDSCKSIAAANSLALDRFLYQNGIDFKCSTLKVGSSVCIMDSCKLHTVCRYP